MNQNNPYAHDILGNTEVEIDFNNTNRNSLRRPQQLSPNIDEQLNESVNSPHLVHNDTEIPQNLITSMANNELRVSRIQINNESQEGSMVDNAQENLQFHNYLENLPTERENDLVNNGTFLNNSQTHLLNHSLEKKPLAVIVSY